MKMVDHQYVAVELYGMDIGGLAELPEKSGAVGIIPEDSLLLVAPGM